MGDTLGLGSDTVSFTSACSELKQRRGRFPKKVSVEAAQMTDCTEAQFHAGRWENRKLPQQRAFSWEEALERQGLQLN